MFSRIANIWRKEILDSVRDRKTLTQSLLVPLIIGIFYAVFNPWLNGVITEQAKKPLNVPAQGIEYAGQPLLGALKEQGITLTPAAGDLQAAVSKGEMKVAMIVPKGFSDSLSSEKPANLTLYTNRTSGGIMGGGFSAERLDLAISNLNRAIVVNRVQARNIDPAIVSPITLDARDLATPDQLAGFFAALTLPMLVALLAAQSGLLIAIDVTAGEKERGTLEALLVTPASDLEIFVGKLASVFTMTVVPMVITFSGFWLAGFAVPSSAGAGPLPITTVIGAVLISLPLAFLFNVVTMMVSVRTKAFKDAQSAATPVIFAALIPSVAAAFFLPSNLLLYLVPIYGPAALVGGLAIGSSLPLLAYVYAIGGTLVAALIGTALGMRMFNRERLLYSA